VDLPGVFDFASLVDLDYEPNRCVIIGGSKVAIEYGSFFQAAGCPTTIVSRSPRMRTASLHHVDEDLRRFVVDGMRNRGMTILEGAEPVEITGNGRVTGVVARTADGTLQTLPADFVFLGTGERACSQPFVDTLGVEVDARGSIVVNPRMQTSMPGVYAIGDLIGPPMEMFKARKCGMAAARNIMGEPYEFDFAEYPDFLHSTYEVTWVGLTEAEARERYEQVVIIQMPPGMALDETPLPLCRGQHAHRVHQPGCERVPEMRHRRGQPPRRRCPSRRLRREDRVPVPRSPDPSARRAHHRSDGRDERAVPELRALRTALPAARRAAQPHQPLSRACASRLRRTVACGQYG
jgi:hypothetical protein